MKINFKLTHAIAALVALGLSATPAFSATPLTGRATYDFDAHDTDVTLAGGGTATNSSEVWYSSVNGGAFNGQIGAFGGTNTSFGTNGSNGVVLDTTITSTTSTITRGYLFNGTGGDDNDNSMGQISGNGDLTWEFWLNPTGAGDNQVIYEDGGSGFGIAAWYNGTTKTVNFGISNEGTATASITPSDFSHVVMTYNSVDAAMNIYVNTVAGTSAVGGSWNGGDKGGIGELGNSSIVSQLLGADGLYEGHISVFRVYEELLSSGDIATSYGQYAIPEPSTLALLGGLGLLVLSRRRRS